MTNNKVPHQSKVGKFQILWFVLFQTGILCAQYSTERAHFKIKFKNEISPYRVIGTFILPNENLKIEIVDQNKLQNFVFTDHNGITSKIEDDLINWQAPESSGLYPLFIHDAPKSDSMQINVFVLVPLHNIKDGYLNGYHVGEYPDIPLKNLAIYKKPPGLIEVTSENRGTLVSPHFRLEQFLCKQPGDYPKYVLIKERLLLKLELILEELNKAGHHYSSLHIMSGYRTPYYNKLIGNVKYSRHVWGGAADVFVDEHPQQWLRY